jgi:activator of HSP90 ATPase
MLSDLTRRDLSVRVASLLGLGSVFSPGSILGFGSGPGLGSGAAGEEDVSRASESIHQEVSLNGSRKRVYEALTDAKKFTTVTSFSPVMKAAPAQISREAGGAFSLFGGHIVGRHVELVADQRLVQAWRVVDWDPGIYSIVRFELKDHGAGTTVVLDHNGFPNGKGQHLADGWNANYWEPFRKFLS